MTYPIATVTLNPAMDKSSGVRRVMPDKKLRCSPPRYDPGGGGLNVARAIQRLGGRASALWSRGGPFGAMLSDLLDREGIAHQPLPIKGITRENVTIHEEESGQQFRFVLPGPSLLPNELEAWLDCIRGLEPPPHYLVLSGSLPPDAPDDFYAQIALEVAPATRVVLDTSGPALREALDAGVYLAKPNAAELAAAAQRELYGDVGLEEAALELISRGCARVLVVSLGGGGALVITREGARRLHAPSVRVRSRVGAGDCMVAGMVLGLERGADLEDACALGVAAGTAAVMTEGTELCRLADVERLRTQVLHTWFTENRS